MANDTTAWRIDEPPGGHVPRSALLYLTDPKLSNAFERDSLAYYEAWPEVEYRLAGTTRTKAPGQARPMARPSVKRRRAKGNRASNAPSRFQAGKTKSPRVGEGRRS